MLTQDEALQLLSARVDGELTPEQEHALDDWLRDNPEGKIVAEAFQSQDEEMRRAFEPRRQAAAQTAERVMAQILSPASPAAAPSKRSRWRYLWHSLPPLAGLAVVLFIALVWLRHDTTSMHFPSKDIVHHEATPNLRLGDILVPRPKPVEPVVAVATIGQKLTTGPADKRRANLPDGSSVYLDQNTSAELVSERTVRLERGRIFVEAAPADKEAGRSSFLVWTPKRKLEALGTKFAVDASDKGLSVLVTQGSVKVEGANQPVAAGQVLKAFGPNTEVAPAKRASYDLAWMRDLIVASDSPLVPSGKFNGGALVAVDPYGQEAKLSLVKCHIDVHFEDGFARTTIDQTYFNFENFQMEGTFYFPLPPDASLSRLAMYVANGEMCTLMEGGMAERDHARQTYERIRHARRDPALLEWVDGSLFKMRVFPLEARQEKRIILSYSQRLPVQYGRTSYRFPAGHSLNVVKQWSFEARVKGGAALAAASPSHPNMKIDRQGSDLILRDKADQVKADHDVVLELSERQTPAGDVVRWSSAEHEGAKYLMLRYRPELPGAPRREGRNWVFLFEASGARDPLVARAQVEVIRALLNNAEHDDTFALLTVGTRVHKFTDNAVRVTDDNVRHALAFLDQSHLIGALNLEQGLREAEPYLSAAANPHLVHLGGGIATLGEQRTERLIAQLPEGTRYVGVAVGKRFSPAFMKTAAEKTSGLFTQINPDEPLAWRGFELAAALNTPRLLNISLSASHKAGEQPASFLAFSNAVAQGEEFAAVARIKGATPEFVTVHGTLNGVAFDRTFPVQDVAANAGYLPRTWAKLEIDRLLAEDAGKHRQTITDLSKAMYVMTPFTSLLVLENEAMYKEFNVDRGRKDHWAMYPCPEKIPTVYVPDANRPVAWSAVQFATRKPHENVVKQTIVTRTALKYLNWPLAGQGKVVRPDLRWIGKFNVNGIGTNINSGWVEPDDPFRNILVLLREKPTGSFMIGAGVTSDAGLYRQGNLYPGQILSFHELEEGERSRNRLGILDSFEPTTGSLESIEDKTELFNFAIAQLIYDSKLDRVPGRVNINTIWEPLYGQSLAHSLSDIANRDKAYVPKDLPIPGIDFDDAPQTHLNRPLAFDGRSGATRVRNLRSSGGLPAPWYSQVDFDGTSAFWGVNTFTNSIADSSDRLILTTISNDFQGSTKRPWLQVLAPGQTTNPSHFSNQGWGPWEMANPAYYSRPSFNGEGRVFTDLVAYAPGMSSSVADTRAAIEAEAAPRGGLRRGNIEAAARKRIQSARTTTWRSLVFKDSSGAECLFQHDGQGRYAYEHRIGFGLIERVVCDGVTILHLYPELGIGARRAVSRFHRAELCALMPDVLPPADDLNFGCDVKLVDENTVALVPLAPIGDGKDATQRSKWIEIHLVFEGNRLAQRKWMLMPDKKEIGREVYGNDNSIKLVDAKGKETAIENRTIKPGVQPDLKPDVSSLVVLPLPLRSREFVYRKFALDPNVALDDIFNFRAAALMPDEAIELLASAFAGNNGSEVDLIWKRYFAQQGDRRSGFFTLLLSSGRYPNDNPVFRQLVAEAVRDNKLTPLLRYLALAFDDRASSLQKRTGAYPGPALASDFLSNLLVFQALTQRWHLPPVPGSFQLKFRASERERALAFVRQHAGNAWGWCTLSMITDRANGAEFHEQIAAAWETLAEKSALPYQARYEQALNLMWAGKRVEARDLFRTLFQETFKIRILPPIDARFRDAFCEGTDGAEWRKLMRDAANESIAGKRRPIVVLLAWQCKQLGDQALADELLALALREPANEAERVATSLAAIEYLWAVKDFNQADVLATELLGIKDLGRHPMILRLASRIAEKREDRIRQFDHLEKALDAEFSHMPETFNVEPVRRDYAALLQHFEWLAEAARGLNVSPPADLLARTVRAADRWRSLDPEATNACNEAAKILRLVGGAGAEELAWDFLTTPLALRPNESEPWLSLAESSTREGSLSLADQCYEAAFAAEPTNAQILWDRAQLLERRGEIARSRVLLKQLATSDWQPRFEGLKAQSRQAVEGR